MYPPATLERLRAVKAVWDPGNLFRRNHNIRPA
jgi:FAD/FMN-containing dehydrogenase